LSLILAIPIRSTTRSTTRAGIALAGLSVLLAGPLAAQEQAPGPRKSELAGSAALKAHPGQVDVPPASGLSWDLGLSAAPQPQSGLVWELVEPARSGQANAVATASDQPQDSRSAQSPQTTSADLLPTPSTLAWEPVTPGQEYSDSAVANEIEDAQAGKAEALEAVRQTREASRWIVGIGGGARIGAGEPTYGMAYGRLGYALDEDLALSIRPSYIFGNSDQFGEANNEGAFQMPVTLDFAPNYWVSPYIGIGIATNTDSNGSTDLLLSAGLDFRLTKNISIVTGLNYIRQTDDADSRDIEGITVLYLRF